MSQSEIRTVRFVAAVPQFTVPDLVRTAEYYRDVLGFQLAGYWDGEKASPTAATPPVFAIVRRDQVQVFFNRADQPAVRTGRAQGGYDAYLSVVGIDALAEELRAPRRHPRWPRRPSLRAARGRGQRLQWLGPGIRRGH
jgi:hypothetical protein